MAAVQFKIRVSEAGALGLFGQTTGDAFDIYNESEDGVLFGSTSQKKSYVEVVVVAKDATHYPSNVYAYSGTISKKVDGYWHTQWTGKNTAASPSNVTAATKSYTKSTFPITIVDEHGTHLGTPNCTDTYFLNESYIGLWHEKADTGYTFTGWTITVSRTSSGASAKPTFVSPETGITSTSSGNDLIYSVPASYEGALIFKPYRYYTSSVTITANYTSEPVTKTVSWCNSDSSLFATTVCTVGKPYVIPDGTPDTGQYSFAGWYTERVGGDLVTDTTVFTDGSATTLYAHRGGYVPRTVSWMVDGSEFATTTCVVGDTYTLPSSSPSKAGYTFAGWFDAESGGSEITAETAFTATATTTAYARWTATVSWMTGSSVLYETTSCTVGSGYVLPQTNPTKAGYTFLGWFTAESGGDEVTNETTFSETSATILYAHWSTSPTPSPSGGGTGLLVRSASSDYLVFSATDGALVYDAR